MSASLKLTMKRSASTNEQYLRSDLSNFVRLSDAFSKHAQWRHASINVVPSRIDFPRFALARFALQRSEWLRSTPYNIASVRQHPCKVQSEIFEYVMFARVRFAPERSDFLRSNFFMLALDKLAFFKHASRIVDPSRHTSLRHA
jgi:hypothetical protein